MGLGAICQKQLHKLRQILFIDYFLKKRGRESSKERTRKKNKEIKKNKWKRKKMTKYRQGEVKVAIKMFFGPWN